MKHFLTHGANPNEINEFQNTPLYYAVGASKISIVNLLLDAGADVIVQSTKKYTPLILAHLKVLIFKPEEQSSELKTLHSEAVEVFEKLKDHVLKLENGEQLLSKNLFLISPRLMRLPLEERKVIAEKFQENLRMAFKKTLHPFL